ncbi:MAG TPA: glycosyl transferase [Lachnospiraceae bacterium]|nr:glycosyl transferase [Lachnospiraceae bacterium]
MCEISVVLPVYNGENHIGEAIESVLSQTFRDFELIIINDCSTDDTAEIIKRYGQQDKRIRIINNSQNKKLPVSLNIGFQKARGKYLTWTSHDNCYKPEAFAQMHAALEKEPEYGLVYADYSIIDRAGTLIRKNPMKEPDAIYSANVVGACFLYRKTVADQVGKYDTDMFLAEDYDYWIRIYQHAKLKHLPQNLYLYRCHADSLSATKLEDIKMQTVKLWFKHFDFISTGLHDYKKRWVFYDTIINYAPPEKRSRIIKYFIQNNFMYCIHVCKNAILHQYHAKVLREKNAKNNCL